MILKYETHVSAPANVSFCAERVGKSASQIGWIVDVGDTTRFLLDINTIAFSNDSSTLKINSSVFNI